MTHTIPLPSLRNFARSLTVIGGALGLGVLLTVPAVAASPDDAATTWTANFQAVNSTPIPSNKWMDIRLLFGCRGAASKTKVDRNDTLDVACVVDSESAYLAYTIEWVLTNLKGESSVKEHSGSVSHSCEQDEIARVTFTNVGSTHLTPTVTRSTECVDAGDADDDST